MILALASLALHAATAQDPAITITSAAPKPGFVMHIADFPADYDSTSLLQQRAVEKCGTLSVRFGKFTYNNEVSGGKPMIRDFVQYFSCFDPATDPYKPVPADWKPSDRDKADANAFALRFLQATETGNAAGATMFEPIAEVDHATWIDTTNRIREHGTGPGKWAVDTSTWLNNPEAAAHPGAYVIAAVFGKFAGLNRVCGYLLLYREAPGRYWVSQRNVKVIAQKWVDDGSIAADKIEQICNS